MIDPDDPSEQEFETPPPVAPLKPKTKVFRLHGADRSKIDHDPAEDSIDQLPEPASDLAYAAEWIAQHGDNYRYAHPWGWMHWTGHRWEEDVEQTCFYSVDRLLAESMSWPVVLQLTPQGRRGITSNSKASSIYNVISRTPPIPRKADRWNLDPYILATPDGSVNLLTGEVIESARDQYCTMVTACAPAPGPHPIFDRVMQRAAQGNEETLRYLWRAIGALCSGDRKDEAFFMLSGPGGSGKGTLTYTLAEILGGYAGTVQIEAFLEQRNPRHSQEIAVLRGKRFVHVGEAPAGAVLKDSVIKLISGGDIITANRMRKDSEQFLPTFSVWFHVNTKPILKDTDESMRRRLHLIEFPGSIPEEERDTDLKKVKLPREYPHILHSMIQACLEWQRIGLAIPQDIRANVTTYLRDNDNIADFLEECVEGASAEQYEIASALYAGYREWCGAHGEKYVMTQKAFGMELGKKGHTSKKKSFGNVYHGLKLKQRPQPGFTRSREPGEDDEEIYL